MYLGQTTSLEAETSPNLLRLLVWPNPAQDQAQLRFEAAQAGKAQLTLYNLAGQAVWNRQFTSKTGENQAAIPLQALPAGMYWLQVQTGSQLGVRPLSVQH